MHREKALLVFIDSLPYFDLEKTGFLQSFANKAKLTPGFGYSINVKAELFGGYRPDELGFFCEYQYDPHSHSRFARWVFSVMSVPAKNYYADRILHKLLSKVLKLDAKSIPFQYFTYFRKGAKLPYEEDFPLPTIFSQHDFEKIIYAQLPASPDRDERLFQMARDAILKDNFQNLFVASADLDHLTHRYGIDSAEHVRKVLELDRYLEDICCAFQTRHPEGKIVILSDHGMAAVTQIVETDIERRFGVAKEDTYVCFVEATMLRIWVANSRLQKDIEAYLRGLHYGQVIESAERESFKIACPRFGNVIFLLDEGKIFLPSFYARRQALRALHGYHPSLESQKGMFLSNIAEDRGISGMTADQVFHRIHSLLP